MASDAQSFCSKFPFCKLKRDPFVHVSYPLWFRLPPDGASFVLRLQVAVASDQLHRHWICRFRRRPKFQESICRRAEVETFLRGPKFRVFEPSLFPMEVGLQINPFTKAQPNPGGPPPGRRIPCVAFLLGLVTLVWKFSRQV